VGVYVVSILDVVCGDVTLVGNVEDLERIANNVLTAGIQSITKTVDELVETDAATLVFVCFGSFEGKGGEEER
jgi:hypothetical protein